jgi:hypothetical protein
MTNWVEKLAKAIEKEGISYHGIVKVGSIHIYLNEYYVDISQENGDAGHSFYLSIDEHQVLRDAISKCEKQTAEYLIDQIMKLN